MLNGKSRINLKVHYLVLFLKIKNPLRTDVGMFRVQNVHNLEIPLIFMAVAISKVSDMATHNGKADDVSYIGHDQLKRMTDAFSKVLAVVVEDFIS